MKKSFSSFSAFLFLILFAGQLKAMDFSGYDIKAEQFYPQSRNADLNSYSEHFRTLCPRKYGAAYRFSSYIEKQVPLTAQEKSQLNSYAAAAMAANQAGDFIGFHTYRRLALEIIENQKTDVFALCVAVGPSKKAAWKKSIDSARVDLELFLAKLGYYDLKFKFLNLFE